MIQLLLVIPLFLGCLGYLGHLEHLSRLADPEALGYLEDLATQLLLDRPELLERLELLECLELRSLREHLEYPEYLGFLATLLALVLLVCLVCLVRLADQLLLEHQRDPLHQLLPYSSLRPTNQWDLAFL